MPALNKEIANRLGLTIADAELTDEVVLKAMDEALAERAADTTTTFTAPEGTVVVDQAKFDELTEQASKGAAAFAQNETSRREAIVDQALTDGKIAAASRDTWLENLAKNEAGTVAILNTLATGQVVNTHETGHAGDAKATSDEDRLYNMFVGDDDKEGE